MPAGAHLICLMGAADRRAKIDGMKARSAPDRLENVSSPSISAGQAGPSAPGARVSDRALLQSVSGILSQFIAETDPYSLFGGLLDALLALTGSEYGFIGEIFHAEDGSPYIKSYATTNIAWSPETRRLYDETREKGMVFSRPDSLYGAVMRSGQLVISNHPAGDPRSGGLPQGHPPLDSFMGMPFYGGGELLGVAGIANRPGGYHQALAESLRPFLTVCGTLIQAYRNNLRHSRLEQELHRQRERRPGAQRGVALGAGYEFHDSPLALMLNGIPVLLTRKELALLNHLVRQRNRVAGTPEIERVVWHGRLVGESSLRSLMRRLRDKAPELAIRTVAGVGYLLTAPE